MTSYLRYKQELRTVQDADDIESWITVRGNHIPIKKGQSKEEAVKSFLEHQAGKNDLPQGTKWSPTNKNGEGTGNKSAPKKEKYDIRHGASIQNIENMINAHADKKAYKSWKEEEEYIAEKLKEEGIYAYGNQIKEAMKNVYGDNYTKERNEESSKKWSGAWSKRANKPETLGEAAKNATSISKMTKMSASERDEEVGYPMLEIAYSDVDFSADPEKNRSKLSKAIKESGHENAELMQTVLSNLSSKELKDADSVRKGINNYIKSYNTKKNENKEESKKDESWGGSYPKFNELTEKYMPKTGESDNELGEVLRSINRVAYRYYNDGDMWNKGYGKETVNWAVKHLAEVAKNKNTPKHIARGIENGLYEMKTYGVKDKDRYETSLKILMQTMEFASKSDIDALANIKKSISKKTTDSWHKLWGKK